MSLGRTDGLIKSFRAGGACSPYRVAVFGADNDTLVQATAATQTPIGIFNIPVSYDQPVRYGAPAPTLSTITGDTVDAFLSDIAPIEYGASVTYGDRLTFDAQGRAIPVPGSPVAGTWQIGIAGVSGSAGTIGACIISRQRY